MTRLAALVVATVAALVSALLAAPVGAATIVDDSPVAGTPHVLDGKVLSVVRVGDRIVLGGSFTSVKEDGGEVFTRRGVLAFDPTTMQVDEEFDPAPNGAVNVVLPAADGASVYVGGRFSRIGGAARDNVARVRLVDGAATSFDAGRVNDDVADLRLVGSRLWVAGRFTRIAGHEQTGLATVRSSTGAFDRYMRLPLRGVHRRGLTSVTKLDVTPQKDRLVAIGNFVRVDGKRREQLVQLLLPRRAARLAPYRTRFFQARCAASVYSYVQDVDIAPSGSYFVVATTGGYRGESAPCDTTSRFELRTKGGDVQPSWVSSTGGDTIHAVEVTDSVVYAGGHQRWQNNPLGKNKAGPGAVARSGIAALEPANGLPYTWNPGREPRGVGVFDFLLDDQGLWVVSDTTKIAGQYRARVALLPDHGAQLPVPERPGSLRRLFLGGVSGQLADPAVLHRVNAGGPAKPASALLSRVKVAGGFGRAEELAPGDLDWSRVTGAFMLDGRLYAGTHDGSFTRRSFDGRTQGRDVVAVDGADRLVRLDGWHDDVSRLRGIFYDRGRIYYTLRGSTRLFYRYFSAQSDVVGARRFTAAKSTRQVAFRKARGTVVVGNKLFWATKDGYLLRTRWVRAADHGAPKDRATVVSGPADDGLSWTARTIFALDLT